MTDRGLDTALIRDVAAAYQVPATVLAAQVLVESSGDPFAFRYEPGFFEHYIKGNPTARGYRYGPIAACSFGLLQIVLEVAMEDGYTGAPQDLFIPRIGLAWGTKHLANLVRWANGDIDRALAAYNGGKLGNLHRPFRNQAYVEKVRKYMETSHGPA